MSVVGCGSEAAPPSDSPEEGASAAEDGPAGATSVGLVAAWDMCYDTEVRLVDGTSGAEVGTLGLRGRPSPSPDGRYVASLDDVDGRLRVAGLDTGTTMDVADLGIPESGGDSCGTSGEVLGWSPDQRSLLVRYTGGFDEPVYVDAWRVDGSDHRTLATGHAASITAAWLPDGAVLVASIGSFDDRDSPITVERHELWGTDPPATRTLPRPDVPHLFSPSISPSGDRIALSWLGELETDGSATSSTPGGIIVVDVSDGQDVRISDRRSYGSIRFSSDGERVAFVEYDHDLTYPAILVVAAVDGSGEQVVDGVSGEHVAWGESDEMLVVGGFSLDRVDLSTGDVAVLVPQPGGQSPPDLVPAVVPG